MSSSPVTSPRSPMTMPSSPRSPMTKPSFGQLYIEPSCPPMPTSGFSVDPAPTYRRASLRPGSMYGGAGGSGVRISQATTPHSMLRSTSCVEVSGPCVNIHDNKKATMQSLNDRLASYLDKVRSLEKANTDLELKIRQFLEQKAVPETHDYTAFKIQIRKLQDQIASMVLGNAAIYLGIDNAKLASDDFKVKHDSELSMRQCVEADIAGLRRVLDELTMSRSSVEMHLEDLREELMRLKINHEEEMLMLRSKVGCQVNVEVDAAPQECLATVMESMREHYERVTAQNSLELETWYQTKTNELNQDVAQRTVILDSSKSEIIEVRRTLHSLEIELQAEISRKASQENVLDETQLGYANLLAGYQRKVDNLEEQLTLIRADMEGQAQEYQRLLHVKTKLEMEIAEYRRLLDGDLDNTTTTKTTRVVTIIQEVDAYGNVLSSERQTDTTNTVVLDD